jgi:hypothetical protein
MGRELGEDVDGMDEMVDEALEEERSSKPKEEAED